MASTTDVHLRSETHRAFVEWIQERSHEGEQLLIDDLALSPRYYFEQNSSQYASEFFTRIDRWRRWLSGLITGLHRRIRHTDHLIQDAATRFAETRLLTFTISDFNDPTISKPFDLRDRVSFTNGAGWGDIGRWFRLGREEPIWEQVRQTLLTEVREFTAMVLEQLDDLQLVNLDTGLDVIGAPTAASVPVNQTSRFTDLEARGEGAHASVWKATDTSLRRVVALRVVRSSAGGDQEAIAHARTMAKPPQHPNIVTVYELVSIEDPVEKKPVIAAVMEFVDGDKLRLVCKRRLTEVDALRLCGGLLAAVAHYHEHGFAHLDLHADNVLASKSMDAKVLDPKTYRTELFASTELLHDQVVRDVKDVTFLLREVLINSEMKMEIAIRFHEIAANATSIADLLGALTAVTTATIANVRVVAPARPASPEIDTSDASSVLLAALNLARTGDRLGWRQLEDRLRRELVERLGPWRAHHEPRWPGDRNKDGGFATTDSLLDVAMGRLIFALTGVYSDNPAFTDQRRIVDDLLSVPNWSMGGTTAIVEAPRTLVFLLHYLHGALCMAQGNSSLALQLALVTVADRQRSETRTLWAERDLSGWPKLLGGTCTWAWEYLCRIRQQRPVLEQMFALQSDFDVGLTSYSMLLSLNELAADAARAKPTNLSKIEDVRLDVPPLFIGMPRATVAAASTRTFGNRELVERVAQRAGADPDTMRKLWPSWKKLVAKFGHDAFDRYGEIDIVPLCDLA